MYYLNHLIKPSIHETFPFPSLAYPTPSFLSLFPSLPYPSLLPYPFPLSSLPLPFPTFPHPSQWFLSPLPFSLSLLPFPPPSFLTFHTLPSSLPFPLPSFFPFLPFPTLPLFLFPFSLPLSWLSLPFRLLYPSPFPSPFQLYLSLFSTLSFPLLNYFFSNSLIFPLLQGGGWTSYKYLCQFIKLFL